jgi:hypothetical protein
VAKYCKKPVIIEATQWFKQGDHTQVGVKKHPEIFGNVECGYCGGLMGKHGWIHTLEGGHIVCPGDWIITGVKGEVYPCKPDIFTASYEPVPVKPLDRSVKMRGMSD